MEVQDKVMKVQEERLIWV